MSAPLCVPFRFQAEKSRASLGRGSGPRELCLQAWEHLGDSLPCWNEPVQHWVCCTWSRGSDLAVRRILIRAGTPREWGGGSTVWGSGFLNFQGASQWSGGQEAGHVFFTSPEMHTGCFPGVRSRKGTADPSCMSSITHDHLLHHHCYHHPQPWGPRDYGTLKKL